MWAAVRGALAACYFTALFWVCAGAVLVLAQLLLMVAVPKTHRLPFAFVEPVEHPATLALRLQKPQPQLNAGIPRVARVALPSERALQGLASLELSVELHIPESEANLEHGVFALHAWFEAAQCVRTDGFSASSAVLYKSRARVFTQAMLWALPMLLGWSSEYQHHRVALARQLEPRSMRVCVRADARNASRCCGACAEPGCEARTPEALVLTLGTSTLDVASAVLRIRGVRLWALQLAPKLVLLAVILAWYVSVIASLVALAALSWTQDTLAQFLFGPEHRHGAHGSLILPPSTAAASHPPTLLCPTTAELRRSSPDSVATPRSTPSSAAQSTDARTSKQPTAARTAERPKSRTFMQHRAVFAASDAMRQSAGLRRRGTAAPSTLPQSQAEDD
mmetsp:Transcript_15639/g.42132  ORF Transcript_15639/g.42132 Transcript_15639/m.42132 type:complete len:394 (+) Transcript_15639:90-1271(+)